jgi:hypothetical protein
VPLGCDCTKLTSIVATCALSRAGSPFCGCVGPIENSSASRTRGESLGAGLTVPEQLSAVSFHSGGVPERAWIRLLEQNGTKPLVDGLVSC